MIKIKKFHAFSSYFIIMTFFLAVFLGSCSVKTRYENEKDFLRYDSREEKIPNSTKITLDDYRFEPSTDGSSKLVLDANYQNEKKVFKTEVYENKRIKRTTGKKNRCGFGYSLYLGGATALILFPMSPILGGAGVVVYTLMCLGDVDKKEVVNSYETEGGPERGANVFRSEKIPDGTCASVEVGGKSFQRLPRGGKFEIFLPANTFMNASNQTVSSLPVKITCNDASKKFTLNTNGYKSKLSNLRYESRKYEQFIANLNKRKKGYVVGRVYLKLDGFKNNYKEIVERYSVELSHVVNGRASIRKIRTNHQGYFVLSNISTKGYYYVKSIQGSRMNAPLVLNIPRPDHKARFGKIYQNFSSRKETNLPIIDIGETRVLIKKKGKLAVERSQGATRWVIDPTSKRILYKEKDNIKYPGLIYYSSYGNDANLKHIAKTALGAHENLLGITLLIDEANSYIKDYKFSEARRVMNDILLQDPPVLLYKDIAKLFKRTENYTKSVYYYKSYLEEVPDDLEASLNLGITYLNDLKTEEAIEAFKYANRLSPENFKTKLWLVKAYIYNGNYDLAMSYMDRNPSAKLFYDSKTAFQKVNQFSYADKALIKAANHFKDGSLKEEKINKMGLIYQRIKNTEQQNLKKFVLSYLKEIQSHKDYDNWVRPPYESYVQRNYIKVD
jgi:tetratricopeptide (TPR) repeat protein